MCCDSKPEICLHSTRVKVDIQNLHAMKLCAILRCTNVKTIKPLTQLKECDVEFKLQLFFASVVSKNFWTITKNINAFYFLFGKVAGNFSFEIKLSWDGINPAFYNSIWAVCRDKKGVFYNLNSQNCLK